MLAKRCAWCGGPLLFQPLGDGRGGAEVACLHCGRARRELTEGQVRRWLAGHEDLDGPAEELEPEPYRGRGRPRGSRNRVPSHP